MKIIFKFRDPEDGIVGSLLRRCDLFNDPDEGHRGVVHDRGNDLRFLAAQDSSRPPDHKDHSAFRRP